MTLADRVVGLHEALKRKRIPHAFGGAIALAYATEEPRGTRDIDVNVFVDARNSQRVLAALPEGIARDDDTADAIARDGQVRLWWDDTPVDLFFNYAPIHDEAAQHRRSVPFEGRTIPVLGAVELAIFKAMFDRGRDWGDLEEMAAAGELDLAAVRDGLEALIGPEDERYARLDDAYRRGSARRGA